MSKINFQQTELSEILEGWTSYKLSEIMEIIGGGTPKTTVTEYWGGKIPWLSVVDFGGGNRWVYKTEKMITQKGLEESSTKILKKGQLIISARGTVGEIAQLGCDMAFNQSCYGLDGKQSIVANDFLYYLLKISIDDLRRNTHGAVFDTIIRQTFDYINVVIPPLQQQRAIAKILSDLDEKIELNRQMNKTLESIAQAIFKRWFVDFEFPGYEKTKIVDGLPDRWHQGTLGEIVTIESGKRPGEKTEIKTSDFTVPLIGASSVMGYVKDALYKEPILIIGRVGTHGIVQRVSFPSFPSDNTLVIRSKYFEFAYQILRMIDYDSLNVGTTQPLITQTAINKYEVMIPSNEIIGQFEICISVLFKKVVANNRESESLMGIRDSLLPRLMSGKIRVDVKHG